MPRGVPLVLSALVAALLAAPGAAPAAAQGPGPHTYTVESALLETTTGPPDAEVPVTLDYDLYVPDNASAQTPQPAMVVAHGFGNSKTVPEVVTLAAFFASHGYVVLTSSHQGFGASSGCISLDLPQYDGRNVSSLIDVLAARPDVAQEAAGDPIVGMVGGSYGGGHQAGLAAVDDRLDAISPGRTWHSLQFSLVPNNRVTSDLWAIDDYEQGVFKRVWTSLFFASGMSQPANGNGGCDPVTQQTLYPGAAPCPGFIPEVCPIYQQLLSTGDSTASQRAFIHGSAASDTVDGIDIPILLTQGQSDTLFTLAEAIATFERAGDARIILNDGGHGYPPLPGEGEPYGGTYGDTPELQEAFAATYFAKRYLGFFGHHLRGDGDPGPRVAYFRDWVPYDIGETGGTAEPAYGMADDLPVAGMRAWLLDAATPALLDPSLDGGPEESSATLVSPPDGDPAAHSETPNFTGPGQPGEGIPPSEVGGQNVVFDSGELTEPFESVGAGTVRVHVANVNGMDPVLFAKLYDVAPDGSATLIRRLVAPVRVPAIDAEGAAGLPADVLIRLPGIVHRFEAGHRVRLVLATTDDSYRNATVADQVTITTRGTQSVLLLPASDGAHLDRLAGRGREHTAHLLADLAFPDGADVAVLASFGDFPDALAAGGLAAAIGAPILPPTPQSVHGLDVGTAYLVGGESVIPAGVEEQLRAAGITTIRVAGDNRHATAAALARQVAELRGGVDRVILARGDSFADALAAGSLSATGAPILLVDRDTIPAETAQAIADLDPAEVIIAGGPAVISDAVAAATGRPTRRLGGATRYETAQLLLEEARLANPAASTLLLASGANFPDALAAAPAAHALGGLLMITDPADIELSPPAEQVVAGGWTRTYLVGGYAALGQALDGQVGNLLNAAAG